MPITIDTELEPIYPVEEKEKMLVMIFDTETTGLPKKRDVLSTELHEWPYIVQLSYVIVDTDAPSVIVKLVDNVVKLNEGVIIPEDCVKIHGISNATSEKNGQPIDKLMDEFLKDLASVQLIVGHNVSFDVNMVLAELMRLAPKENNTYMDKYLDAIALLRKTPKYCTMREGTHVCAIQMKSEKTGKSFVKSPKLSELHQHLFKTVPSGLHNSMVDVLVCMRCYYLLKFAIDPMTEFEEGSGNQFATLLGPYLLAA